MVGVDESAASVAALKWAAARAVEQGAELDAIHAWVYPYLGYRTSTHEPHVMMALDAAKVLESVVTEAFGADGAAGADARPPRRGQAGGCAGLEACAGRRPARARSSRRRRRLELGEATWCYATPCVRSPSSLAETSLGTLSPAAKSAATGR